jgi:NhaA family Na+:H+ antiporter
VSEQGDQFALRRPVEPGRDHLRWGGAGRAGVTLLIYGDYLCPYCRRIRGVIKRLRTALGDRLTYVFRHFPNERAHPGAEFAARAAEAATLQGRFWEMHDALYDREPPLTREHVLDAAVSAGLDMQRFARDVADPAVAERVDEDLADGRRNGVSGTPTIFVDGQRYDGAWDLYSMLEALDRPVGARVQRTARAFANLPASAGLVLIVAAAAALACVNSPLGPLYQRIIDARLGVGVTGGLLSLSVGDWCSEGLLTLFFLLVGLEIRREMTVGAFTDRRAAVLPIVCAFGGVLVPALIYLALNQGPTAPGWSAPTSTGIAFALGILAVLGSRAPTGLKVFVAALAVVDDIISMLTLAIFYPQGFEAGWMAAAAASVVVMVALNRWRVYAGWPYLVVTIALWLSLHAAGVSAALAGVVLAIFLPTRPAPAAGPLLAQAATALAALDHAQGESDAGSIETEPIWEWASRNLSAAAARLLSPADRVERAIEPWSAYVILPLFAFSATGIALDVDLASQSARHVLLGVVLGLVIGKPLGVALAAFVAVKARIAVLPNDSRLRAFIGAALLCGVSDPVALLMADKAFPHSDLAAVAKIGVLAGSLLAAGLGIAVLATGRREAAGSEVR